MQELPLEGDEHAAWQKMQGLLDQNMPVSSPVITPKSAISLRVKLLYIIAAIVTAVLIYYAASHVFAGHHEKTNKPAGKHALINSDSATNNNYRAKESSLTNDKSRANTDDELKNGVVTGKSDEKTGRPNSSGITGRSSATPNAKLADVTVNKTDAKHAGNNSSSATNKTSSGNNTPVVNHSSISGTNASSRSDIKHTSYNPLAINKTPSGSNRIAGTGDVATNGNGTNTQSNKLNGHLITEGRHSVLINPHSGLHAFHSQNQRAGNQTTHFPYSNQTGKYGPASKPNQQLLAGQSASTQNNLTPSGNGATTSNNTAIKDATPNTKPAVSPGSKTDSTNAAKTTTAKQTADTKAKNQADKSTIKNKTTTPKKTGNSKFELDVKLGANTNSGSNLNPFLGISANYNFHKKWGVSIGVNAPYTRIISGSYSKSNLNYVTVGDSNKQITHNSGKLIINSSRKIKYVVIPVLAAYKVSDKFTVTAGPVISIPIKANTSKNTLGALSSSADTTTVKEVTPYVTGTAINSNVNFSISAGVRYAVKRFYFDAGYLQGISPYTVSSSLGSGKIYYHTIQIGIGYQLFKSKSK